MYTAISTNIHSSVEAYANADCAPQAVQQQMIHSNNCTYLPLQSARVFFLEKTRANCRRESRQRLF